MPLRWYPDEAYQLFAINVLVNRDYLDEENSEIEYRADGRVKQIKNYVFKNNCKVDVPIFKLAKYDMDTIFISEQFISLAEKEKLTGLNPQKIGKVDEA